MTLESETDTVAGLLQKFRQRSDMGKRAWSAAKPTQPNGDSP
jgi:hypothetical protein